MVNVSCFHLVDILMQLTQAADVRKGWRDYLHDPEAMPSSGNTKAEPKAPAQLTQRVKRMTKVMHLGRGLIYYDPYNKR